jgi:putative hydroxymethylpyrimidine transporter CytX
MSAPSEAITPETTQPTEVAPTLAGPTPKVLGFTDQGALWANLGVSLLGFAGAFTVLQPPNVPQLSMVAAIAATIVGTLLGSIMVGVSAIPGARTGAPAMVVLRGLFGGRLSYLPTALNIFQLIGWGTFELVVISQGAQALFHGGPKWLYVVITGIVTTAMTIRPLGAIRVLRRYVTVAVAITLVYFFVQVLRHPLPPMTTGSWSGFWAGSDAALAVAVSWIPVASDYSRHSRSPRAAFGAVTIGYSITQILCYVLGLIALANVSDLVNHAFDPFLAVPFGALFFGILVLREVDQSFTNVYSTGASLQNLLPRTDRRVITGLIGALTTGLALAFTIGTNYQNFLLLIGSVFVPLFGVLAADYFLARRWMRWDTSERAKTRWGMLVAWLLGLAAYQLINPGSVSHWSDMWVWIASHLHFTAQSWMSASLFSFLVAAIAAGVVNLIAKRGAEPANRPDPS